MKGILKPKRRIPTIIILPDYIHNSGIEFILDFIKYKKASISKKTIAELRERFVSLLSLETKALSLALGVLAEANPDVILPEGGAYTMKEIQTIVKSSYKDNLRFFTEVFGEEVAEPCLEYIKKAILADTLFRCTDNGRYKVRIFENSKPLREISMMMYRKMDPESFAANASREIPALVNALRIIKKEQKFGANKFLFIIGANHAERCKKAFLKLKYGVFIAEFSPDFIAEAKKLPLEIDKLISLFYR